MPDLDIFHNRKSCSLVATFELRMHKKALDHVGELNYSVTQSCGYFGERKKKGKWRGKKKTG